MILQDNPEVVEFSKWKCKGLTILADTKEVKSERNVVWYNFHGYVVSCSYD